MIFGLLGAWELVPSQPRAVPQGAVLQESGKTPIYRGESYSVLVDAVVTDRHNRLISNLSSDDFTIYEDGVRQQVESFQTVLPGDSAKASASVSNRPEEVPVSPPGTRVREPVSLTQYTVLMLDYASTELENQFYVRSSAKKYYREHRVSDEEVAVVSVARGIRLLQNFTNDSEKIIAALDHLDALGSSYAADRNAFEDAIESSHANQENLQSQLNTALGSAVGAASPRAGLQIALIEAQLGAAQREESRTYALRSFLHRQQSRPILEAIRAVAEAVAPLPGRKTLILVSEGFGIPAVLEPVLFDTVKAANRARLAIYAVDGKGLFYRAVNGTGELHTEIGALQTGRHSHVEAGESEFDRAREAGDDVQDSTLRFLASASGGRYIRHTNDFADAFRRIERESRSYYLLSYRPTSHTLDGQYRQIRVTVGKPGVEVRARPGYFAMPYEASLLSPEEFRELSSPAVGEGANDFPLYLQPARFLSENGAYAVELPVEVPLHGLKYTRMEGDAIFAVRVFGLVRDSRGNVVYSFRGPGPTRVKLSGRQEPESRSLMFIRRARLDPGIYAVDVEAVDRLSGRKSFSHVGIQLEPVPKDLSVSSLVLSHHVETAAPGEATVWNVGNARIFPCAERSFRHDQKLVYYFNVYNPRVSARTGSPEVEVNLSLARDGRPVGVRMPEFQPSRVEAVPVPHIQVARFVELGSLPPGDYVLRAKISDLEQGKSVITQASFKLVP